MDPVHGSAEGHVELAHTRLAIQGLGEAGAQPMHSYSGNSVITYNGEIYNAAEVASHYGLKIADEDVKSDTRVLLELIEKEGLLALKYINGIFAFGFYNLLRKELLVVRDRKGVSPFYVQARQMPSCSQRAKSSASNGRRLPADRR